MLNELAKGGSKVTGLKQTRRAILDGRADSVYIAEDAEMRLRLELSSSVTSTMFRSLTPEACVSSDMPAA